MACCIAMSLNRVEAKLASTGVAYGVPVQCDRSARVWRVGVKLGGHLVILRNG
jgi:hypothetical protein